VDRLNACTCELALDLASIGYPAREPDDAGRDREDEKQAHAATLSRVMQRWMSEES